MKKVVLLGDSIRLIGYGPIVEETLKGEYEVWQPEDNCRFAAYTYRMIREEEHIMEADIIHWNNGLWDETTCMGDGPFTPLNVYVEYLERIAKYLLKYTDKVIFATTTPAAAVNAYNDIDRIREYNAAAIAALTKLGVQINDLFSVVAADREAYICEDTLHLSEAGAKACAEKVLAAIRSADN